MQGKRRKVYGPTLIPSRRGSTADCIRGHTHKLTGPLEQVPPSFLLAVGDRGTAHARKMSGFLMWFLLVSTVLLIITSARMSYVSSAVNHFDQLYRICQPYMTNDEQGRIISTFAQISCQHDYVAVIEKLKGIATSIGLVFPEFDIW